MTSAAPTPFAWRPISPPQRFAWNRSSQTRVILLFEVWRPDLTQAERTAVQSLFTALDATGAASRDWEI